MLAVTLHADARIEEARGNDDEAIDLYLQYLDIIEYTTTGTP